MEDVKETPKELSLNFGELNDDEVDKFAHFIDCSLKYAQDVQILHRNVDFSEAEALVLYPDYMYVRHKAVHKRKKECESLAMKVEHENTYDITECIVRESIGSITLSRQLSCDCDDCLASIAKGEKDEQSDNYTIEIAGNRPHQIFSGDKDFSSWLQEHLMDWRFKKGVFKHKDGMFAKPKNKKK